jgi:tripeptide aminopeptidase
MGSVPRPDSESASVPGERDSIQWPDEQSDYEDLSPDVTILDEQQRALNAIATMPDVQRALGWLTASNEQFLSELIALSEIPAPTFQEQRRAGHVAERFRSLGLEQIQQDSAGNVLAAIGSGNAGRGVAFMAHLDTVFPETTDVRVRREGERLHGPGIGDNAAGLAGLMHAIAAMRFAGLEPTRPIWLVASTGEEGLGDLCGARAAVDELANRVDAIVAIEGALLGRVTHEAVGSRRWRVRFSGPGGHSWHDFGRPSAVTAAARAAAALADLSVPTQPRTTLNVGRIEGGIGVNVIPSDASMLLDMRSTDSGVLARLVKDAEQAVRAAAEREGAGLRIEAVGDRPAGSIARDHPLVDLASSVLQYLGIEPRYEAASTDANIPLSRGIPAVTVGISHGGGIHTEAEWLEIAPCITGVSQLLLLALALCGVETAGS